MRDLTDASPSKRYVLFRKQPSGKYKASYLDPPLDPIGVPCEFEGDYPNVLALTSDMITFNKNVGTPVAQKIDSVPTFPKPQTATY